ncbi:hypothetical protein E1265_35815 [Streptomyces sp. 8K308]|uniref:hypothetical protein n=1 Tax=Streptomyces sp. 8K308 TaxID=2530388 RepID=UPI00104C8DCD|nr:hypothetical protein [Streptomyces sp. 8K308]TDC04697.1 hypothetical protein E1265_35815 [Streptomyces sp. 8K308]
MAAGITMNIYASTPDLLSFFLPLGDVTTAIQRRLDGRECARCGSTRGLRAGGHAYTLTQDGCLGWAVRVCHMCPPASPMNGDVAVAVAWAVAAGACEEAVLDAWEWRRAVSVPAGRVWDTVRVSRPVGLAVLSQHPYHVAAIGPVLEVPARDTVEFLVPPGTVTTWPSHRRELRNVHCVGLGGSSKLPPPYLTLADGRRARCGRRWLTPLEPHRTPSTHGGAVLECLLAELPQRGRSER